MLLVYFTGSTHKFQHDRIIGTHTYLWTCRHCRLVWAVNGIDVTTIQAAVNFYNCPVCEHDGDFRLPFYFAGHIQLFPDITKHPPVAVGVM